jgi:hypothetical protein
MRSVYALRRHLPKLNMGACTFLGLNILLSNNCSNCSEKTHINQESLEQSLYIKPYVPAEELGDFIKSTCGQNNSNTPIIQAFIPEQSLPRELFLADILSADNGSHECAPGPFLFHNDNEIDIKSKRWELASTPYYFVLQLEKNRSDDNFYIASQNGFPINCLSFRLEQQDNTTLVLVPKNELEVGKYYYLYLIQKIGESRQVWIQPLSMRAT